MARSYRFKKRLSDRSGFPYLEREMVKDKGLWVGPDELDEPPPSKLPLGGEGDISRGQYFRSATNITTVDATLEKPTYFITAAGGITPSFTFPYMRVTGSNNNVNLSADPQIAVSVEGRILTLFGVGSTITLENGSGLAMMGSAPFILGSGNSISFIYNTGGTVWQELSRYSGEGVG